MSFQAMAWAVDLELPMKEKFVLLMLANRTNHDTGRCDPSHKRLAKDCGMSQSTVKRAIVLLEQRGLLVIEQRSANNVKLPNQYVLKIGAQVGSVRPDQIEPSDGGVGSDRPDPSSQGPEVGSDRPDGVGSQGPIKQESLKQEVKQEVKLNRLPACASADQSRVDIPADMPGPKDQTCKTFKAWANYAFAYRKRYQAWPVWNAKVAGQVGQLVNRLGAEIAHHVAAYYVSINDARLINDCHSLNNLLAKAEAYHTQWATGRQMNGRTARQMEDTQANINAAQEAARNILGQGERNAFL